MPTLLGKHKLLFGAVTGLEHESEELSANHTILSPEVRWWNPRDVYRSAQIFTSFLEDPAVLKRSYAHFTDDYRQDFRTFEALSLIHI